jgi:hypothetical protein
MGHFDQLIDYQVTNNVYSLDGDGWLFQWPVQVTSVSSPGAALSACNLDYIKYYDTQQARQI